jgi:hypothetical protein
VDPPRWEAWPPRRCGGKPGEGRRPTPAASQCHWIWLLSPAPRAPDAELESPRSEEPPGRRRRSRSRRRRRGRRESPAAPSPPGRALPRPPPGSPPQELARHGREGVEHGVGAPVVVIERDSRRRRPAGASGMRRARGAHQRRASLPRHAGVDLRGRRAAVPWRRGPGGGGVAPPTGGGMVEAWPRRWRRGLPGRRGAAGARIAPGAPRGPAGGAGGAGVAGPAGRRTAPAAPDCPRRIRVGQVVGGRGWLRGGMDSWRSDMSR